MTAKDLDSAGDANYFLMDYLFLVRVQVVYHDHFGGNNTFWLVAFQTELQNEVTESTKRDGRQPLWNRISYVIILCVCRRW